MNDEIPRTEDLLKNLNGSVPKFLRPPMGLFSKRVLDNVEAAGYRTVVGNVYPRDPHLPGKEKILNRVLSRAIKGSIIILFFEIKLEISRGMFRSRITNYEGKA